MGRAKGARRSAPYKLVGRVDLRHHAEVAARLAAHLDGRATLPTSIDLAAFQPAILDQGATGSCTAHSTASAIATAFAAAGAPLYVPSPRLLYATTRALERAAATPVTTATLPPLTDSGAELADVMASLATYGVKPIESMPTDCTPANVLDEPDFASLEQSAQKLVEGGYTVDPAAPGASDVLAAALVSGIPIEMAFFCDTAFENLEPGQVAGAPNQQDPQGGGHAVYLSGYEQLSDGSRAFILTNSWGSSWCNGGRCLVGEAWLAAAWEAWPMAVARKGAS